MVTSDSRGLATMYFTDHAGDVDHLRAAVVWRYTPAKRPTLLDRLLGRVPPPAPLTPRPPEPRGEWSQTSSAGSREARYSRERRCVRVLDVDHPLPDEGTLVLLVDERGGTAVVTARTLPAAEHQRAPRPRPVTEREKREYVEANMNDAHTRWTDVLRADAPTRALIDAR